jgi:hypothetical protein
VQQLALEAAGHTADPEATGSALMGFCLANAALGRTEADATPLDEALTVLREAGDPVREARAGLVIGWLLELRGRHRAAFEAASRALPLMSPSGRALGLAGALNAAGWYHTLDERSKVIVREIGNDYYLAIVAARLRDPFAAAAESDDVRQAWREALRVFDTVSKRRAETFRVATAGGPLPSV